MNKTHTTIGSALLGIEPIIDYIKHPRIAISTTLSGQQLASLSTASRLINNATELRNQILLCTHRMHPHNVPTFSDE